MLSARGADNPEIADELKDYLRAKHNADERLKTSGLTFTIVRPGSLTDNKGTGNVRLDYHLENSGSINREDVALVLVRSLHDDTASNITFEVLKGDMKIGKALEKIF